MWWRQLVYLTEAPSEEDYRSDEEKRRLFRDDGSGRWRRWTQALLAILETNYLEIAVVLVFATLSFHVRQDGRG